MNETAPQPKRRYHRISFTEAQALAVEWQSSGLSRAAFARSKGLDVKCVYRCLSRVERQLTRPATAPAFIPVANVSTPDISVAGASDHLSWHLPHDGGPVTGSVSEMAHLMRLYLEQARGVS